MIFGRLQALASILPPAFLLIIILKSWIHYQQISLPVALQTRPALTRTKIRKRLSKVHPPLSLAQALHFVRRSGQSKREKGEGAGSSARIGWAFLSQVRLSQFLLTSTAANTEVIPFVFLQYYSFLNKDPSRLHCFYTKRSTLIHSTEGEEATACFGQQVRSHPES